VTRHTRRRALEALPRHDVLETLARHYHHLQNEHKRASPESGIRRRIEERLLDVRERFDRLLDEWVPDNELQEAWRESLHNRVPEPPGPPTIQPLVFRGVSDAGSVVEIRGKQGDELAVEVDRALIARIAGEKDFAKGAAAEPAVFRLDHNTEFLETFSASPEALQALADFLAEGHSPPWDYAAELLADGLIDTNAALTPRGRRALARLESGT
jgi:hypothetical protein